MIRDTKLSPSQLMFLVIAFLFGDYTIVMPSRAAGQDMWISFIIAAIVGTILITIYLYISVLNPGKTLIEILKEHFGKVIGSIIGLCYIWYFMHLAALITRTASEYMVTVNYPETPISFINILFILVLAYGLRKGIEVIARASQIFVPTLITLVILTIGLLIVEFDIKNLQPILGDGIQPVINTFYSSVTFPFGEAIVFLMIFPSLNKKESIFKSTYSGIFIVSLVMLAIMLRDLMVLGPDVLGIHIFPPHTSSSLIPRVVLEPIISINLLFGGGGAIIICMYAVVTGIAQVFNLSDYKILVLPISLMVISLASWLYTSYTELTTIAAEIHLYYAMPFQIIIPIILLIISIIKNKKTQGSEI
ncbi:GerAB/ArcD/ProY family transporter [Alkalithermobacter paradoxus]|uniref:Spore germination protein A2 n=1 Tax=Alkalithermobacter paradoxus TaxID=29349 RepID=A0A1V4I5W4_9FIRM|nr:spore germination protein A2 [[Clostridium] thermoalcaliphilum]